MAPTLPNVGLELRSLVTEDGTLELSIHEFAVPSPQGNEVLICVEASPINPSDLGLLLAGADVSSASFSGTTDRPVVTMSLPEKAIQRLKGRVGTSMAVGNEGAGTVVAAGEASSAQALLGRTVSVAGGSMYSQFRLIDASACLVLPEGTPAKLGASSFVNPLTALGMIATMRREGHTALVHTAAASNLGQMLVKLSIEEKVPLVNIVRTAEQEEILRALGAAHVCNSTSPSFMSELVDALKETNATLVFDAVGGGRLVSQTLTAMEAAANANATQYSRYGSTTHKQAYIYGGLDQGPTELTRNFGFAWSVGGWLLTPFLQSQGSQAVRELRERVAAGLTTTFASHYTREVSLAEALHPEALATYSKQATGEKYLIAPHLA
jgi:NADPH:quinone reductase-like Zn-dependent oxidoreductase